MMNYNFYLFLISIFLFIFFSLISSDRIINWFPIKDNPNIKRKNHKKPVSLIGGLYIFIFYLFFLASFSFFLDINLLIDEFLFFSFKDFAFFYLILFFFFAVGIVDDKFSIIPANKIIIYSFLIFLLVSQSSLLQINEYKLYNFTISISNLNIFITSILIISVVISMNLYDGMNLQSSIFYIIFFSFISAILKSYIFLIYSLTPLLIFSYFNKENKVFLGESGVLILSTFLIYILIKIYNSKLNNNVDLIYIFIVFSIPLFDASRLFFKRTFSYGNPFKADNDHVHHLLIKKNYNYFQTICLLNFSNLIIIIFFYQGIESYKVLFLSFLYYLFLIFIPKKN